MNAAWGDLGGWVSYLFRRLNWFAQINRYVYIELDLNYVHG